MANFKTQELSNAAWGFAKLRKTDVALFRAFAKTAERHVQVNNFSIQELANATWALATTDQPCVILCKALARSVEQCGGADALSGQDCCMTVWTLVRSESLKDVWSVCCHMQHLHVCYCPLCIGALFAVCESRG
eukprot:gnl/TRDRNA2_/TRDRNA2_68091_c0_seq1.p1 gnl/TRDRNA2_/TRDRNA2_68091_c0~~gnl/TRDRNA2_/TRDRNA2_68091_c0_seq1.p1  ORF type:complete len:134 (+),score=20.06 gnl/TRDRNA2_/TRDRNA2_68091_c0_seq1:298-699(+)